MPIYYGKHGTNTDRSSDKFAFINNCGFSERVSHMHVDRPDGRSDYQLIYIKSGEMTFVQGQTSLVLGEGHVVLYRPHQPQNYFVSGASTSYFWIHFAGTAMEQVLHFFEDVCYKIGPLPEFEQFCRLFYMDYHLSGRYNALRYEGELLVLLARICELSHPLPNGDKDYSKISPAVLAMHGDFPRRADNSDLATLCGMSKYYFIKLFKSAVGTTPQQYYTAMIIDKSKQLLETTTHTVGEIATLCGIDDALYFSRLFKKHVGLSPAVYRQKRQ